MQRFDIGNPNTAFLRELSPESIGEALRASFIDEPVWPGHACLRVIEELTSLRFAVANIYVYAIRSGSIHLPAGGVYDIEVEDPPLHLPWQEIVARCNEVAARFVAGFGFHPAADEQGATPAFSLWAYDEHGFRSFVR